MSIRERWANVAIPLAGLTAPSDGYRDIVGPERLEGRALSDDTMRMWGCGLTWLGLARVMGMGEQTGDPQIERTYVIGHAVSDVIAVFVNHEAWHSTWDVMHKGGDHLPSQGDCVIIGPGGYHVRACLVTIPDTNGNVDIVEGGHQDSKGHMYIARVFTRVFIQDGILYCGTIASVSTRVYGWGDCTLLPIEGGALEAGDNTGGLLAQANSDTERPPEEP